jgi:hypothetical protein
MSGMPQATRPGSRLFAPDLRIAKLGALSPSGEEGQILELPRDDVVSLVITRVCSGPSHYSITLNNWDSAIAARRDAQQQTWPPFKYNNFDHFEFGMRLRIDMRYWPDSSRENTQTVQAAHAWVPMIAGPITDMQFTFTATEGARLTIIGEDDLFPLKNNSEEKVTFPTKTEKFIIEDTLRRAGYPLPLSDPQVSRPPFFDNQSNGITDNIQDGQSYLEYLQKIAKKYDCEMFVEFNDFTSTSPAVGFHFEPARSRVSPNENLRHLYVLEQGKNLIKFKPTFKVLDQYTEVKVKGRHRVRSRPQLVQQPALPAILSDELYHDSSLGDGALTPGPDVRTHYLSRYFNAHMARNINQLPNQTNIDEERASAMAKAVMRQKSREFLSITGTTIGMPQLRPGIYVEIRKMRQPFDGFYYVEKTITSYEKKGFTTQFTARRPGMQLPPYN